jgi:mRNA interferase MazF
MTIFKFGDIVLVPFPFTDQTTVKKRPAVVVSSQEYNLHRLDIILMAVTSRMGSAEFYGDMAVRQW